MTLKQLHKKIQLQEFKIGKMPFVAIPLDKWYDLEDLILMSDPKIHKELTEAEEQIKNGEYVNYREVRRELGLK